LADLKVGLYTKGNLHERKDVMRRAIVPVLVAVIGAAAASAQDPLPSQTAFEVASIKPHDPRISRASSGLVGSLWTATNFSLFMLVQRAYPGYNAPIDEAMMPAPD
jgi:hypothetical protein